MRTIGRCVGVGATGLLLATAVACSSAPPATTGSTTSPTSSASGSSSTAPLGDMDRAVAAVRTTVDGYSGRGQAALVVLVRVGDQTRVEAVGFTDAAHSRPVSAQDRFRIASLTKTMVATAVLQYVAAGRIGLDDPVDRWLPGLTPFKQITVRHLLSHRSGLHELTDAEFGAARITSDAALVAAVSSHPLDFAPGSDGAYSNVGYTVLGLLVEKLSGQPLPTALRTAVFARAGMTVTSLGGAPTVSPLSAGQLVEDEGMPNVGRGAGGVTSTAADVDRFFTHLFAGDLVPISLVETMAKPTGTTAFGIGGYGLGLWINPLSCGEALGHFGHLAGYTARAWTMRSPDRSVVILLNEGYAESFGDNLAQNVLCA